MQTRCVRRSIGTRRQTLNPRPVVISENKSHEAATAFHSTARSCSCIGAGLSVYPYSLEYQSESSTRKNGRQRVLFVPLPSSQVHAYTLISSPKAYVAGVVWHLLATSDTWAIGETLGAEMKNPVIPGAVGERWV